MDQQTTAVASNVTGGSSVQDLFALSDEQILEIEPQPEATRGDSAALAERVPVSANSNTGAAAEPSVTGHQSPVASHESAEQRAGAQPGLAVPLEPPAWLAAQMKDPWGGEEAREFWDGVEQASASRAQLAQRMLREDPAAFREMVVAGLQALQEAEQGSGGAANAANLPRLAQVFAESRSTVGAQHAAPQPGNTSAGEAHVAAYAAFERAANEDLERSVGGAIERTLAQALPSFELHNAPGQAGAQRAAPLRGRLAASVRADVEKALQGDRQLGEQVSQILSSRRFDNDSRAQIVRLISDRVQQLVPGAAKRVLNEWTQTTLAAHRGRKRRSRRCRACRDP